MRGQRLSSRLKKNLAVLAVTFFVMGTWAFAQETTLLSFDNRDGNEPIAGLIIDASGNLYGTTFYGGADGVGTVFKLAPTGSGWTETVLYSFKDTGIDGQWANTRLAFDVSGNLYGTTFFGGAFGYGTVFELSPNPNGSWTEKLLHSFDNHGGDGTYPHSDVTVDAAGNVYGMTASGGANGDGVVFELTPTTGGAFTETLLHNFSGPDGANPYGPVTFDGSGNLYGTTASGGSSSACTDGCGTVFELSPATGGGWTEKVLRSFDNTDGANPYGGVIFASGNLYGTTSQGAHGNFGAVFELTPAAGGGWREKILHNFNPHVGDGFNPSATLLFDSARNL